MSEYVIPTPIGKPYKKVTNNVKALEIMKTVLVLITLWVVAIVAEDCEEEKFVSYEG